MGRILAKGRRVVWRLSQVLTGIALLSVMTYSLHAEPVLVNRLLIKINESSFSQREMEIYFLAKSLSLNNKDLVVTENNWPVLIRAYKDDMMLYEETRKLHYSQDIEKDMGKKLALVKDGIQKDPFLGGIEKRLAMNDRDLEIALVALARVEKFRSEQKESTDPLKAPPNRRVPSIEKRNYVRYFQEAGRYRYIQPQAFPLSQS